MNAILHQPAFQALESAWRGVDWLLQGVAKSGAVEVRLIDLSAEELAADLASTDRLEETGLVSDPRRPAGLAGRPRPVVGAGRAVPVRADRGRRGVARSDRPDRPAGVGAVPGGGSPARPRPDVRPRRGGRRSLVGAPAAPRVVDARPGRPPVPAPRPLRRGDPDDRRLRVRGIHRPRGLDRLSLGELGPGLRGPAGAVVRQGGLGVQAGFRPRPRRDGLARDEGRGRRGRLGRWPRPA